MNNNSSSSEERKSRWGNPDNFSFTPYNPENPTPKPKPDCAKGDNTVKPKTQST
jgi:hypothetical protein